MPRRYAAATHVLSVGQDGRWRRAMLDSLDGLGPDACVLDVATGTGMVAAALVRRFGCTVVGLDQSPQMLAAGRAQIARDRLLRGRVTLVQGEAERLPFADGQFDAVTFTYLLRYVDDPPATLRELARVLRPGGRMASMDFSVPSQGLLRAGWWVHTRVLTPLLGRLLSPQWAAAGHFLGPNISAFHARHPPQELQRAWQQAGMGDVRVRGLTLGAGLVMSGVRHGDRG